MATWAQYTKVIEDLQAYVRGLQQGILYLTEMRDALPQPMPTGPNVCVVDLSHAPVLASLLAQPSAALAAADPGAQQEQEDL